MAFDAYALTLAMLALGMAMARLRVLPAKAAEVLNLLVLYVCLPAAVLLYLPRLELDLGLAGLVVTPWILMGVVALALVLLGRLLRLEAGTRGVLILCVGLGNTSFIGYPMVRALLGEDALPLAVVYDQLGSFLILSTVGLVILARYSGETRPSAGELVLRMLRFPPLWALVVGLTIMPADPPAAVASGLQLVADTLLPLVMLAVGLSIQLRMPRGELAQLAIGLIFKLVVMPLLALGLAVAFDLSELARSVSVLESAMPPMITAAALAIAAGLAPRLAAALIGYGILLSLVTLPAWAWLLATG